MVDWRTQWSFVCPGPKGGADSPCRVESNEKPFACPDCGSRFTRNFSLTQHKKFYCHKTKGIDHLEATRRRSHTGEPANADDVAVKESSSTTYRVDSEMEQFIQAHPSPYAKFKLCENPRNPQPITGFWPALFDFRGKLALADVEASLCSTTSYQTLGSILSDAHTFHGVGSITFKKRAFVELDGGEIYDISDYRVPRTHLIVKEGAEVRLDQPKFTVHETENDVTISLHQKYLDLLPRLFNSTEPQHNSFTHETFAANVDDGHGYDLNNDLMFESDESDEEEIFSQVEEVFSQVSLEDRDVTQSPAVKRMKLSLPVEEEEIFEDTDRCPHCSVYIRGGRGQISKHIQRSCPENPNLDPLEAVRRKKKLDKKLKAIASQPKMEPIKKEEKKIDSEDDPSTDNWVGGDCGCRGLEHQPDCLRLRGGAGHNRLPRNHQAPLLAPDSDFLIPRLLRPIIPVIQSLNRKFSNRQNRWMAALGPPRSQLNVQNELWPRVVSKHQLPFMFKDEEFTNLFYFDKQQVYQFRNAIIYPMLAMRAGQAQGARGARSSLPHTLTPDSLACLFLSKVRMNQSDRVIAGQLGVTHRVSQKWLSALRNYYFTSDQFIQRNLNLGVQANLEALLQQGIDATSRCHRTIVLYEPLRLPGTRLLVVVIDSRAIRIQQSTDAYLQKRTISTTIHYSSVQKLTVSDMSGLPMITFPLMCSISPAGTDESNAENLITIHETGVAGGLRAFLESPLTEQVTLVLLEDQGFRKFGFDHANRRSFIDYQDDLQARSQGGFRYFTPCFPSDLYRDQNFNIVGRYANLPGGSRHRSRTAQTSAACCTKSRWTVESLFARESHLALLGARAEVPRHYLDPCGIPNFESQSKLMVWAHIGEG